MRVRFAALGLGIVALAYPAASLVWALSLGLPLTIALRTGDQWGIRQEPGTAIPPPSGQVPMELAVSPFYLISLLIMAAVGILCIYFAFRDNVRLAIVTAGVAAVGAGSIVAAIETAGATRPPDVLNILMMIVIGIAIVVLGVRGNGKRQTTLTRGNRQTRRES